MSAPRTEFGAWFATQQQGVAGSMASAPQRGSASGGLLGTLGSALSGALGGGAGAGLPSAAAAPGQQGGDIEAGAGGSGSGGGGGASSPSLLTSLASFLPPSLQQGAGEGVSTMTTSPAPAAPAAAASEWTCGLSYGQRFQAFLLLGCGSLSLYFAAFFVFLPLLLLAPSKFATSFTFASLLWLAGFALLRGPRTTLLGLLTRDKLPFTTAYFGSLLLTLYATVVSQSYFLVLLAVVVQCSAAVWYSSSYIPGGPAAAGALGRMCLGTAQGFLGRLVGR